MDGVVTSTTTLIMPPPHLTAPYATDARDQYLNLGRPARNFGHTALPDVVLALCSPAYFTRELYYHGDTML
jgi:hypothetical protein